MSPRHKSNSNHDLLPDYDFSGAVRGKYFKRYQQGTNVVLLDPDIAAVFRDSASVNDALRALVTIAQAKVSREKETKQGRPYKRLKRTAENRGRSRA